jgi:riboflavin kinase / FMN adenylyltransferase
MNFPLTITASVIPGAGRGKQMGVPTLNVDLSAVPLELEEGIYAAWISIDNVQYMGAVHYGPRPVFNDTRAFEVHVIDQSIESHPVEALITLVQYLREIRDYPSLDELTDQINEDIQQCRVILSSNAKEV